MIRRLLLIFTILSITTLAQAQFDYLDFRWELADVAFSYPASWDEPFAVQQFGVESVILAESDSRNSERSPEIPFITFALQPATDTDATTLLQERLAEIDIRPNITIPKTILDRDGVWIRGNSRDETYFGMGASVQVDDNILSVIGRVPAEQSTVFETNFDVLIRSLIQGQEFGQLPNFGLVWSNLADTVEGGATFTSLATIKLDERTQTLYAADNNLGLLRFDMLSGRLEENIPNTDITNPIEIAIGLEGKVYIGDIGCGCIHIFHNNEWQDPITGLGDDAPLSITTTPDGVLYATDTDGFDFFVQRYSTNEETGQLEQTTLVINELLDEQPILFEDMGLLHFLTSIGDVFQWTDTSFELVNTLELEQSPLAVDVSADGTYVIASVSNLDFYAPDNFLIQFLNIEEYSAGSFIRGSAIGEDGTVYIAVTDENFGEVLALSQRVPNASYGLQTLAPYRYSGGFLSADNTEDIWLIDASTNDAVNVFVQGYSNLGDFDYSMTLIDPDGSEIVTVDGSNEEIDLAPLNRSLENLIIPSDGIYEVHINHGFSEGEYEIVLVEPEQFTLAPDITLLWGELSESHTKDMWQFESSGNTMITITVEPSDPTQLETSLTLYDAQNRIIARSEVGEASDTTTQIVEFRIPFNGTYTLDISKVEGIGKYQLLIDIIEPES